eukprot:TRINITY_DN74748_c0_g1_i1.p2 TRINITY_DN74748_c0_g1~~TRINITY_DN74748_c0_g1_i1.p2  ORF type:complete len:201 (-),score=49.75 TRINITY_DN74748_c0_g1_i1:471-1073(-)
MQSLADAKAAKMEMDESRKRGRRDGGGAAEASAASSSDRSGLTKQDVKHMVKALGETCARSRLLAATIWWTFTLPPPAKDVINEIDQTGIIYNKKAKGARGHREGPPCNWLWATLIVQVIKIAESSAPHFKVNENLINIADLDKLRAHKKSITSPLDLNHKVRHCAARPDYEGKSLIVQIAVDTEMRPVQDALFSVLKTL